MKLLNNTFLYPSIQFHSREITQDERSTKSSDSIMLTTSIQQISLRSVDKCIEGSIYTKTLGLIVAILFLSPLLPLHASAQIQEQPLELIQKIHVEHSSIEIVPHEFKNSFYRFTFKMEVENNEIDLRNLNHTIITIPFILSSLPFIWGSEKTFIIDEIDQDLYTSIERLNIIFKLFYPTHSWSGKLLAKKTIKNNPPHQTTPAVLFSHGLDSVSASFERIEEPQTLITVCGNDIDLGDSTTWEKVKKECIEYATLFNKKNIFIRSNCRFFCHTKKLSEWCRQIYNPWSSALSSFGLAGLAAPLAAIMGHSTILMGSTRTSDFPHPLGSHPLLDNNISFCGITVHHAQPEYDRVKKIKVIAQQVQRQKSTYPFLRVCFTDQKKSKGNNCGSCSRCLRTIMEIIAANERPEHFGFNNDVLTSLEPFYALFKGPKLSGGEIWHWMCVQKHIKELLSQPACIYKNNTELTAFLEWLIAADLSLRSKNNLNGLKGQHSFFYDLWQIGKCGITPVETLLEWEKKIPRSRRK